MRKYGFLIILALSLTLLAFPVFAQTDCQVLDTVFDAAGVQWEIRKCRAAVDGTPTPTPQGTPTATPTATPTRSDPPPGASGGIWISVAEVQALPMTGAWSAVQSAAAGSCTPDPSNQDSPCNVIVQAQALAWARTGEQQYRTKVIDAIGKLSAGCSGIGGRTLALARELGAYIVAADLIDLRTVAPDMHLNFEACLRLLLTKNLDGMTIVQMYERRPNNWGTMAGGTLAALYAYLGDTKGLDRVATVYRGWLGDRSAYSGFTWGDLSWQCNASQPVGINPAGCTKSGHLIDGALPDDMRRGGGFKMPNPSPTGYACGGMTGAVAGAWILHRAGYPAFEWSDRALLRAMRFLERIGWKCTGDDAGMVATINFVYGTNYAVEGTTPGKNYGWQQWTFARAVQADVMLVSPTRQIATGESLADLQDEIEYQAQFGWLPVGNVYMLATDEGEVYAQDMTNGN
jgi:hypothetical protein